MNAEIYLKEKEFTGPVPDGIYPDEAIYWYRKVPGTERHQFIVKRWSFPRMNNGRPSYEVEMTYETELGIWATTKFYGISEDELLNVLPDLESRLKNALPAMRANLMHYQFDGKD